MLICDDIAVMSVSWEKRATVNVTDVCHSVITADDDPRKNDNMQRAAGSCPVAPNNLAILPRIYKIVACPPGASGGNRFQTLHDPFARVRRVNDRVDLEVRCHVDGFSPFI